MSKFYSKVRAQYTVKAEDGPGSSDLQPGSTHPDNYQTKFQSGYSGEQIRQKAVRLHEIAAEWQEQALEAKEICDLLCSGGGKHYEMNTPWLNKGISRQKMLDIAHICTKLASIAVIK